MINSKAKQWRALLLYMSKPKISLSLAADEDFAVQRKHGQTS